MPPVRLGAECPDVAREGAQKRFARIHGTLTSDVTFGGFLGRLHKGRTFDLERQDVAMAIGK